MKKKLKIKKCPVCGAKGYIGVNGKYIHGELRKRKEVKNDFTRSDFR